MPNTKNQQLTAKSYQPEFRELLEAVYGHQAYFRNFFGGSIEVLDGVAHNKNAFSVKTSDIPVVVGTYSKDENVAFGTGTSNSNRFGERKEIIYTDKEVPYTWGWAIHEGIDRHTVNNDLDETVADRLELQARAKTELFSAKGGTFISTSAGKEVTIEEYTPDAVAKLFTDLAKYFTNIKAVGVKEASVNPDIYNLIVEHPSTTTGKGSSANIDDNTILRFKGFNIEEVPESEFVEGEVAYAYIQNVGKQFTGINTARTIEATDFDGVALQGAGKAGEFILDDNKPAVVKVNLVPAG